MTKVYVFLWDQCSKAIQPAIAFLTKRAKEQAKVIG
jgi:hypothetical protein